MVRAFVAAVAALAAIPCAAAALGAQVVAPATTSASLAPVRSRTWVELARTAAIAVSLDTGRVDRAAGPARVWYRFTYATPLALGDDAASRYAATEMRMQVDCGARRARTLELRMESVEGVQAPVPASDSTWRGFAEHPMGQGVFVAGCAALGTPAPAAQPATPAVPAPR